MSKTNSHNCFIWIIWIKKSAQNLLSKRILRMHLSTPFRRVLMMPSANGVKEEAPQSLGGEPFVAMMQAADLWESDDLARIRRMDRTWFRAVLLKRQVSSGSMVIVKIR